MVLVEPSRLSGSGSGVGCCVHVRSTAAARFVGDAIA